MVEALEAERALKNSLQQDLSNLQDANKSLTIESTISKALDGYDIIDRDIVTTVLKNNVIVDDDGVKFKSGDNTVTVDEGVKGFFDVKPHLLKAKGNPGSGAGSNGSQGGQPKGNFGGSMQDVTSAVKNLINKG